MFRQKLASSQVIIPAKGWPSPNNTLPMDQAASSPQGSPELLCFVQHLNLPLKYLRWKKCRPSTGIYDFFFLMGSLKITLPQKISL